MTISVVIDAGHGGKDPGAVGNGIQEKDIVLDVSKRAKAHVEKFYPEIKVIMTRSGDSFHSLASRSKMANDLKADCFVSVHVNGAASDQASGYESFIHSSKASNSDDAKLQNNLHSRLAKLWASKGGRDRGKKKENFHVLRETKCPAVLLELGFITSAKDANLLKDNGFIRDSAECIADGIASYFGVTKSVTTTKSVYRVRVDGVQIGAYSEPENIAKSVTKSINKQAKSITIEIVK